MNDEHNITLNMNPTVSTYIYKGFKLIFYNFSVQWLLIDNKNLLFVSH